MSDSGNSSAMASVVGALVGGSSSNSSSAFQRTAGTTATLGLGFFLLRFVVSAAKALADDNDDADSRNSDSRTRDTVNDLLGKSEVLYQFVKNLLRRLILQQQGFIRSRLLNGEDGSNDEDGSEEENVPMIHKGSCHCRAVCFELIAPQKIICNESQRGKIQFRHARIRAKSFRFVKGAHLVKMYYVNKAPSQNTRGGDAEVGAHSFCSRCGVHFLHAPNSRSKALDVNVECLNQMDVKIKSSRKKINLSLGVPVADQWDQDQDVSSHRYPATIAEEHSPMASFSHNSPFAAYRHHPLMRPPTQNEWDRFDLGTDDGTIDLVFPEGDSKTEPDTPTTAYTTQESLLSSNGVPPTLTLDTRAFPNDAESVVSLSSVRSGYPPLPPTSSSLRASSAGLDDTFGGIHSPASNAGISPSTTPLVRQHLNTYLRKHMSSSVSSVTSASSSRISPSAGNTMPPKGF